MRLAYTLMSCLAIILLISCSKDEPLFPAPGDMQIDLLELKPGQETLYLGYAKNCDSTDFRWTGDTLVARIMEEGGQLYMEERFTEGSPSFQTSVDSVIVYPITSSAGIVTIPQREKSSLFNFYGSDKIHLEPDNRIALAQSDCLITSGDAIFKGDDIGRIARFDVGPIAIRDKTVVSCVPVFDLDAYLLYDKRQLYMSHQVSTSSFMGTVIGGSVHGWIMLEQ